MKNLFYISQRFIIQTKIRAINQVKQKKEIWNLRELVRTDRKNKNIWIWNE